MLIDGSYSNLLQGVSQQPDSQKLVGQCIGMENMLADPVDGLVRRPGTSQVGVSPINFTPEANSLLYHYDNGQEQYWMEFGSTIKVFDFEGNAKSVSYVDSFGYDPLEYIQAPNPKEDLSATTIGDYTIIANRTVTTKLASTIKDTDQGALVVVLDAGDYGREFSILHNGSTIAHYMTPSFDDTEAHGYEAGVGQVVQGLVDDLIINGYIPDFKDNVIYLPDMRTEDLVFKDDRGAVDGLVVQSTAKSPGDLPKYAMDGTVVQVTGSGTKDANDYYLEAQAVQTVTAYNVIPDSGSLEFSFDYDTAEVTAVDAAGNTGGLTNETLKSYMDLSEISGETFVGNMLSWSFEEPTGTFDYLELSESLVLTYLVTLTDNSSEPVAPQEKYITVTIIGSALSTVVWRETTAPGEKFEIDLASMPHALIRRSDGTFVLTALNATTIIAGNGGFFGDSTEIPMWSSRTSGDNKSNPPRVFFGRGIDFITSFQERLVLISGEFLFLSSLDGYFDFWHKTALSILDSDPISIANPSTKISRLKAAVTHDKNLMVFSKHQQFVLLGGDSLTPAKASLRPATEFQSDLNTLPISVGATVLFDVTYGAYSGIKEMYTSHVTESPDARGLTDHIKKYLPGRVTYMAGGSNLALVGFVMDGDVNAIYIYQYLWSGDERVQSAWSRWEFPYKVLRFFVMEAQIIVLLECPQNSFLVSLDLANVPPHDMQCPVYLDMQSTAVPDENNEFIPEGLCINEDTFTVMQGSDAKYPGLTMQYTLDGTTVKLKEDPEGSVIYGLSYVSSYTPVMPLMKDQNGVAIRTNRLTVNSFNIMFNNSGEFYFDVQDRWNGVITQTFTGRIVGSPDNLVGVEPVVSGVFNAGVSKDRDTATVRIWTDRCTPMSITDIEWTGQFTKRGRRF